MTDWPEDTLPSMALWLARRMDRVRQHPAAADIVAEVTAAVRAATRAIDRPAQRVYAGPCPACRTDLLSKPGHTQVTCTGCGTIHDIAERQDAMRTQLDDQLVTAVYASAILPGLLPGTHVSEKTIHVWASRHRLEVRSVVKPRYGGHPQPLYRFRDIVNLVLERDTRAGLRVLHLRPRRTVVMIRPILDQRCGRCPSGGCSSPSATARAASYLARWKGTTTQRGLGASHQRLREQRLAAYRPGDICVHGGEPMWWWPLAYARRFLDLPHLADRSGYLPGLSCAHHNRSEGVTRRNLAHGGGYGWATSRVW